MQQDRWTNQTIRNMTQVVDGNKAPALVLKNATYLNTYLKRWDHANIWLVDDRIVYVGERLPESTEIEIVDCQPYVLVPGYIEPHSHPFMLTNPVHYSAFAAKHGTTTMIHDNLPLFLQLENEQAFQFIEKMNKLPYSAYWWARLDGQSAFKEEPFKDPKVSQWIQHPKVVQVGELTGWPQLMQGDEQILSWIQEARHLSKKVEGHFPGASEKTLTKLALLGAEGDHEAMNAEEILRRLNLGYMVTMRESSIRPDLREIIRGLQQEKITRFDRFMVTLDGAHPYFHAEGLTDHLIKIMIEEGIPLEDAYLIASYNAAVYYELEALHGSIAVGRIANINFLSAKDQPTPVAVLAQGKWVDLAPEAPVDFDWEASPFQKRQLDWTLSEADLEFEGQLGIELVNNVITKSYERAGDLLEGEAYLALFDQNGSWRVNSFVKNFVSDLGGLASSYSGTDDILLLGQNKPDMQLAFQRMREIGGGIVVVDKGRILYELSLPLNGHMSTLPMEKLIEENQRLQDLLAARGYAFADAVFTILFFSATHLPFVRITPQGIVEVKSNQVIQPSIER